MAECFAVTSATLVLVYNRTKPPFSTLQQRCRELGAAGVAFEKCNVAELAECEGLVERVSGNTSLAVVRLAS